MLDLDDEALGVDLAVEGLASLPAGRVAVACPVGDLVAPEALLDVGHWSAVLSPGPLCGKRRRRGVGLETTSRPGQTRLCESMKPGNNTSRRGTLRPRQGRGQAP